MDEYLLVFLEPGIERGPVEPDGATQRVDRGAGQEPCGMWPDKPAGAQPLRLRDASAGLLGAALPLSAKLS